MFNCNIIVFGLALGLAAKEQIKICHTNVMYYKFYYHIIHSLSKIISIPNTL